MKCRCVRLAAMVSVLSFGLTGPTSSVLAQPPLDQMSGIPLPAPELPDGTITVRVIRGRVTNNVAGQEVELRQGDTVETATTDVEGRATFFSLNPGQQVQASTVLDSQLLQSQPFTTPGRGGIRVMLVGLDPDNPPVPSRAGEVTFGPESWVQVELVEESVEVYYFLDVLNTDVAPVDPAVPIVIDLPSGAEGTTVLRSSSARARADGPRVEISGPFDPGVTPFHFAYILPYSGESLVIEQPLPVTLSSLLVSVEKWGTMDFVSSQVSRRMEIPPEGPGNTTYMLGSGPAIPAGRPFTIELVGLPHRSRTASWVARSVALAIFGFGFWGAMGSPDTGETEKRRMALEARKEKLFRDLVRIERQRRAGKVGSTKYASRRSDLFRLLEKVYRELDEQLTSVLLSSAEVGEPARAG